jgi:hypothetical protein
VLVGYFKRQKTASMLTIPFIITALWLPVFFNPAPLITDSPEPFYRLLLTLCGHNAFILTFFALLSVIGQSYLINMIIVNEDVLDTTSHFPGLCYGLLLSSFPQLMVFNPALMANWPVLLVIYKLFTSYRKETAFFEVFDAGFCIAIASLIYFPSLALFFLIWLSLIIIRPFIWREWIIPLIGLVVPYLFVLVFYFWFDRLNELSYLWNRDWSLFTKTSVDLHQLNVFLMVVMAFIFICTFFKAGGGIRLSSIRSRGNFSILVSLAYLTPFTLLFLPKLAVTHFSFLAITLSVLLANYLFAIKRSNWAEFLFFILIIAIIVARLFK